MILVRMRALALTAGVGAASAQDAAQLKPLIDNDGLALFFAGDAPSLDQAVVMDTDPIPYLYDGKSVRPIVGIEVFGRTPAWAGYRATKWLLRTRQEFGRTVLVSRIGWSQSSRTRPCAE